MRFALTLGIALSIASTASAGLHAIHFVDAKEGWTVGDDGVILHSIDGGKTWEPQKSGTKASLRGVTFLDEQTGWIVGREEHPFGGGSVGVVLFTRDGGLSWQRQLDSALPGLNSVRFTDKNVGLLLGDGVDPYGSGMFRTTDGGKSWAPVKGARTPSWSAGDFQDGKNGILVGPWGRLATFRDDQWAFADPQILAGRGLRATRLLNKRQLAVGEGGLVITSVSSGRAWAHAEIGLPPEIRTCLDFNAIASFDNRVWVAGRPGSVVLRSDDGGATWALKKISTDPKFVPVPINALCFVNRDTGWAVGDCGRILATRDGGETWEETNKTTPPATTLVQARAKSALLDTVAYLSTKAEAGAAVIAVASEGTNAGRPMPDRLRAAVRSAGGFAAEEMSAFPLPQYFEASKKEEILAAWDQLHGQRAPVELVRQLVLALRTWQPNNVVTDDPASSPLAGLIGEALVEAVKRAEDPNEFPEQLQTLGLRTTQIRCLFAAAEQGPVAIDTTSQRFGPHGPRDVAFLARGMLSERPSPFPMARTFQRLTVGPAQAKHVPNLSTTATLPNADDPVKAGLASFQNGASGQYTPGQDAARERTARQFVNLVERLPRSEIVLTQLVPMLKSLPDDEAARAAFTVATAYARMGEWDLARETFLLMVDRVPAHSLSAEAYRWLIHHNASSEVRRRHELRHFALVNPDAGQPPPKKGDIQQVSSIETVNDLLPSLAAKNETRQWSRGGLEIHKRLALFGSIASGDPRVQFSVQSARRSVGEGGTSRAWNDAFAKHVVRGPWADAAAAETWIDGTGAKPRRVAGCRFTDERPNLDGKLDDPCWKSQPPMPLSDASGTSQDQYPTEAWLAYDAEFLYVAVRCKHPRGKSAPAVKVRTRDANLDPYDRVSLLLDLDRDYATYYRLEFDQRGCVREDCWGDVSWNPKWYVAAHQTDDCWTVEAAIPLGELTSSPVALDTRWACNLVRIVPGRGVQSVSQPADVEPRPEGMCILHFQQDGRRAASPMTKAP